MEFPIVIHSFIYSINQSIQSINYPNNTHWLKRMPLEYADPVNVGPKEINWHCLTWSKVAICPVLVCCDDANASTYKCLPYPDNTIRLEKRLSKKANKVHEATALCWTALKILTTTLEAAGSMHSS